MKKILSLTLAVLMVVSMIPTAFAAETYTTEVVYTADAAESYEVTVPATLAPGESGTVYLSGTWDSTKCVVVTADEQVILTNQINNSDTKTLGVSFEGIALDGSNTSAVSTSETVSVGAIDNALFGTWTGKFNYYVEVIEEETTTPMLMMFRYSFVTPEDANFGLYDETFSFESGMTWGEFIESEYNTDDIFWTDGTYIYYGEELENSGDGYLLAAGADKDNPETLDKEIIENQSYYTHAAPAEDGIPEQ